MWGWRTRTAAAVIDTLENKLIATIPLGQGPQGVAYVPGAVPDGAGTQNLVPLGVAANAVQLSLGAAGGKPVTQITLFDQGLVQVLQAGATGLEPRKPYVLALSTEADGGGTLQPLAAFMTNPAGAAVVNAIGPIRQVVQTDAGSARRWLVIAPGTAAAPGAAVQVQQ